MNIARLGFLISMTFLQFVNAIDATNWDELTAGGFPLTGANSLIYTFTNPAGAGQTYNGDITFNDGASLNVSIDMTRNGTIYNIGGGGGVNFDGNGNLNFLVRSTNGSTISNFFRLGGTLNSNSNFYFAITGETRVSSIFNGNGNLNFNGDTIIDLSNAVSGYNLAPPVDGINTQLKGITDIGGTLNINTRNENKIVQLTGDLIFWAGVQSNANINFTNPNSFMRGKILFPRGTMNLNFSNGASGNIEFYLFGRGGADRSDTTLNISNGSIVDFNVFTTTGANASVTTINANNGGIFRGSFSRLIPAPVGDTINVTLGNSGKWIMGDTSDNNVADSAHSNVISSLTINNNLDALGDVNATTMDTYKSGFSIVDMTYNTDGSSRIGGDFVKRNLNVGRGINGSGGIFRLYGQLSEDIAEQGVDDITATGRSFGTHIIQVYYNPRNFSFSMLNKDLTDNNLVVANITNRGGNLTFVGGVADVGIYSYKTTLASRPSVADPAITQWYITTVKREKESYLTRVIDSLYQSQYRFFRIESDTLSLRLGELRNMYRVSGVWGRVKHGRENTRSTDKVVGSDDDYTSIWTGYDENYLFLGGQNFFGVALNTTVLRAQSKGYLGNSRTYGISLYDTFRTDDGVYIDAMARYYYTDNKFALHAEVLRGNNPRFGIHNLMASLEIGKRYRVGSEGYKGNYYYLEPQVQATTGFVSGASILFKDWANEYINTRLDFNVPLNTRVGLFFGRNFDGPRLKGDVKIGTSFEYDFNTGGEVRMEDFLSKLTQPFYGDYRLRLNVGTNVILNEYFRVYVEANTSFLGEIDSTFMINAGVRINFGRKHPRSPSLEFGDLPSLFDDKNKNKDRNDWDRRNIPTIRDFTTEDMLNNKSPKRREVLPTPTIRSKKFNSSSGVGKEPTYNVYEGGGKIENNISKPPTFVDDPTRQRVDPGTKYNRDTYEPRRDGASTPSRDMNLIRRNSMDGYR